MHVDVAVFIQARPLFWLLALLATSGAAPAGAIPRLDLTAYPLPAQDQQRWLIQLPGLLPRSVDPAVSSNPADWRVQLIVGQNVQLDCNQKRLVGNGLTMQPLNGSDDWVLFSVSGPVRLISTRMACPPGEPSRQSFLSFGSQPYLVPYNASYPIVVDVPIGLEVQWHLWKSEASKRQALKL